jgi:GDSL-like lipase/acylhydrolase family protein
MVPLYRPWLLKVLLSIGAGLLTISVVLAASTYKLATRAVRLEDLSPSQRQRLVGQASRIVPPIYQPFPLSGPMLFYVMTPKTKFGKVLGATLTTNDLGFRKGPTGPKPEGVKRIVVIGDSWTFGQGVEYDDTFTHHLEQLLNRTGAKWQVYNLGVPGWNIENEIAALRTLFSRLQPDVVVLCPTSNDIDDSYDVWNGRLVNRGFNSGGGFRHSYLYQSRWIRAFGELQAAVDFLEGQRVPSLIFFLAEWRALTPYYARLSDLRARYTVVPGAYLDERYRLPSNVDAGQHASPMGHQLIAGYLYNALLAERLVGDLPPFLMDQRVVFPGHIFDDADVEAEFRHWSRSLAQPDLIPLNDGFVGSYGFFSVPVAAKTKRITVQLRLIDDPGLYPLTVEVRLESPEQISARRVFQRFASGVQTIEIAKPRSLDVYSVVEVRVDANRVVAPKGLTPMSMQRPTFEVY